MLDFQDKRNSGIIFPSVLAGSTTLTSASSALAAGNSMAPNLPGGIAVWSFLAIVTAMAGLAFTARSVNGPARNGKRFDESTFVDEPTGLPNRRRFDAHLNEELSRAAGRNADVAVMHFDLDRLEAINDRHGREVGDKVIVAFGERLGSIVGRGNVAARLASDEFAVIATEGPSSGISKSTVELIADRVFEAMSEPIDHDGATIRVNVSIGATVVGGGTVEAEEVSRQADLALRQAKAGGRGRLQVFDPQTAETLREREALEADVRQAVRTNAFHLTYQALVSRDGDSLRGIEASVRWTHPERGEVSPAEFIPVAEDVGLIDRVGDFVLRRACIDIGPLDPVRLALNVSPAQFRRNDFVRRVERILKETDFDPGRLELGIAEGVFMSNPDETAETIRRLREIGVRLALAGFGAGYSDMSYLREFPLDRIKLDGGFVDRMEKNAESRDLVSRMIGLGGTLGLSVTAEGVETEEQAQMLKDSGCDEPRGHLFSTPVIVDELLKSAFVVANTRFNAASTLPNLALVS